MALVMMVERLPTSMISVAVQENAQGEDLHCRDLKKMVEKYQSGITNEQGLLICKAPGDWKIQVVIHRKYRWAVLHNAHYPEQGRHTGVRRIYDTLQQKCYCSICSPTFRSL